MAVIKAACACKDNAESNAVLAVRRGRLAFIEHWRAFTWLMVLFLSLATDGWWLAAVAGWHLSGLLNPEYHCNRCDATIGQQQFLP